MMLSDTPTVPHSFFSIRRLDQHARFGGGAGLGLEDADFVVRQFDVLDRGIKFHERGA